ncbi:hypothetical protein [Streptosporangium sp. NPDC006007]|uniref:hypothetical protein n=1 Tax=Streptosporangium sp. NPDC006007 TaxID=3154575 RepID=UPI0033B7BF0F
MTALMVLGPGDRDDPGWARAGSIAEVERLVRAGRTVVVTPAELAGDLPADRDNPDDGNNANGGNGGDLGGDEDGGESAELAAAALCAWAGARVFRTTRPGQVRLAVEMADSLAGRRPPTLTRRGLA